MKTGLHHGDQGGEPVVGRIAATQVKYDLAISKGASMVQCSNVAGITPVSAQ